MSDFSFRLGYALGKIVREFCDPLQQENQPQKPARNTHHELDTVPAMVRKGVKLNQWYEANLHEITTKPRRKKPKTRQQNEPMV